ncbi:MAG: DUF58 domain-containing protein [Acidimicrobiales bacterium]
MTGRGWAILAAAAVCTTAGRVLGLEDLFLIGAGLLVMLGLASIYVRVIRTDVTATRRLLPARVHAGSSSRVELTLTNRARRRSPVLTVRDPFDRGTRSARFLVAPLAPGEVAKAAYRVPTDQRGVFDLGPLDVSLTDPFGLAASITEAAPQTRLTVYPRIDQIRPPPLGHGDDPLAGADHPRALTGGGSDFYALRPYVRGDDLRKVHWPSTAKAGDLMLRQDEMPWQARSTLLLDTRRQTCPPPAFELLVSAAASVVVAVAAHGGLLRLFTTGGYDSRWEGGTSKAEGILEHLAGVGLAAGSWTSQLGAIRRAPGGGALVAFTTAMAADSDLRALAALRGRFATITLVLVGATGAWRTPGVNVVEIRPERPFSAAWAQSMAGHP